MTASFRKSVPSPNLAWFNLRPGEEKSASLLLLHSFFMGISTVYFETAASALFLARFEADILPYVYIAAAVLSTFTGFVYARVKERLPFARLMLSTLVFLLTFVCIFRLGLSIIDAGWLVFSLFIWYRVLSILTDLEYWAVATRIYDVRQSKRLFSLVGSGEVVARISGSFSVPLLVSAFGVANLIVLSAAGLLGCILILFVIIKAFPQIDVLDDEPKEKNKKDDEASGGWKELIHIFSNRGLRLIFLLAFLGVLGKYFVDFAFLTQMQTRYQDVENLAGFFGIFSGVTQVVNLLLRVVVSGRIISRFGVKVGLVVLPVVHVFVTVFIIMAAGLGAEYLVFWLVISNQGVYKTLKHPIDYPSFKILYQPLPARKRLSAQVAVEVIVTPITIGVAGGIMLLFSTVIAYDPIHFAYIMLLTFAGWLGVAVLAFRQYSVALVKAIKRRTLDGSSLLLNDEQSIALVQSKLLSEDPGDVIFSLDLLRKMEHPSLESHLIQLLDHPSPDVRRYTMLEIERLRPASAVRPVSRRLPRERSPQVCAAALRALAAIGGEASLGLVTGYLEHEELQVCRGALIGLLRQEDPKAVRMAQSCLEQLTKSSRAQDKRLAAEVMAEIRSSDNGLLMTLLGDETESVRKAAFRAAGRSGNPAYVPVLVEHVSRRKYRRAAEDALIAAGETAVSELTGMFENKDLPRQTLARLAKICGRISGETAIQVLLKGFDYPDPEVRKEVLAALARCRYRADESQAQAVRERIRMEIADAVWNLSAIRDLDDDPGLALARRSLGGQAETNRERVFFMLSFLYDRKSIESAWENLRHESKEKRAYALEVLDVTLSQELKQLVLPLVEDMGSPEALRRLQVLFPQKTLTQAERLRETLSRPGEWLSPWNKACAVYSAAGLSGSNLSVTLKSIPVSSSSLLAETTRWALAHLNGSTRPEEQRDRSSGRGNSRMLTIEKVILLKGVNMFSKTSEELLTEVAFILEEVELKPGEVVFEKGDVGESMYIIVDGRVRVYDGDKTINHLGKKEIFGELVLLDPEPRSASVQAVEETRLFRLDRDTFFELMADNIGVVSGVMEVLCQRLRRMTNMAMERR